MASLTQWAWVWVSSGSSWWTRKPGVVQFMPSQRVGHDWATELNWTEASSSWNTNSFQESKKGNCGMSLSVQFSRSVVSNSLWPHDSQHARPPCPSPTPRIYSNSCPLSQWCHPTMYIYLGQHLEWHDNILTLVVFWKWTIFIIFYSLIIYYLFSVKEKQM